MALQFHKLKVSKLIKETEDATTIAFEVPAELKSTYEYKHGQYITLRFFFEGKDERRTYSMCSSPVTDDFLAVTVKKVKDGKVSPYITANLKVGDLVDVMPPLGNFTIELNPDNQKTYMLFAGGSGITPIFSILKTILAIEKKSKVVLIYANINENTIIFKDKLIELQKSNSEQLTIIHQLSEPFEESGNFETGRIDKQRCLGLINILDPNLIYEAEYFMCGPGGLMAEIENALNDKNIDKKKIHKEVFTVAENIGTEVVKHHETNSPDEKVDSVRVILYGEEHTIPIEDGDTILVAGIKAGIDPPFSCQIGACSTCRARLKSGRVEMEADDALSEEEIEEGFVLTCTSHPQTNDVLVDYDDNY